jgi:hypothetical protein
MIATFLGSRAGVDPVFIGGAKISTICQPLLGGIPGRKAR